MKGKDPVNVNGSFAPENPIKVAQIFRKDSDLCRFA